MEDEMKKRSEEVALFRHGLVADLARLEPGTKGLYRLLEEKAAKDYCIPVLRSAVFDVPLNRLVDGHHGG